MHRRHKQTTLFCLIFLYELIILMNKNKNNYLIFLMKIETSGFTVGMTHRCNVRVLTGILNNT